LFQQIRNRGNVADIVRRRFGGHNIKGLGVDTDVQLTPASA
jgi:hypothetical protein